MVSYLSYRVLLRIGMAVGTSSALLLLTVAVPAKPPASDPAETFVQEALHCEIYGDAVQRANLLKKAAQSNPDFAPAKWHQGLVKYQNDWIPADRIGTVVGQDVRLAQYMARRAQTAQTAADQYALARWCRNQGLRDQERAHLLRTIELQPNHLGARKRLGFRRLGDQWVDPALSAEVDRVQAELQAALERWRPKIVPISTALRSRHVTERDAALEKIRQISDPEAIPALEQLVTTTDEAAANVTVETFSLMPGVEPSLALTRQGMLSPWSSVRRNAAQCLKQRPKNDFVPLLLNTMVRPVSTQSGIARGANGRVVHRVVLQTEARDHREMRVVDTNYLQTGRVGRRTVLPNVRLRALRFEAATSGLTSRLNLQTIQWNERAGALLSVVSDQPPITDPGPWWQWWSQETERETPQGYTKPQLVAYSEGYQVVQGPPTGGGGGHECLAKGTPVHTNRGLVPIEQIETGDLVLAQNVDTGELALKPVIRPTERPATELVRVRIGNEDITTTGGHPIWVAGDGWVKARSLKPGMEVHTLHGPVQVRWVEAASKAVTYNLVVADSNSFFAGKTAILTHDFTEPRPTSSVVPGLSGVTR